MTARSMTKGEIKLAETVFGSAIHYALVKIFNEKWWMPQPDDRAMSPNGNIYYAPNDPKYSADFSLGDINATITKNINNQNFVIREIDIKATFIHELVHVWQHQNGVNLILRGPFERDYEYLPLHIDTDFNELNIEQQAEVVRHYFCLLHNFSNKQWAPIEVYQTVIPFVRDRLLMPLDEDNKMLIPEPFSD